MKKLQIRKDNITMKAFFEVYAKNTQLLASASIAHNKAKKELQEKLEGYITALQENNELTPKIIKTEADRKADESLQAKISQVELELMALEKAYKEEVKPYQQRIKNTLSIVDSELYTGYIEKITTLKRGKFLEAIRKFADVLEIEKPKQAQVLGTASAISELIGAKLAANKKIVDGKYIDVLSENQFKKLFMSAFCELYIKIDVEKVTEEAEEIVQRAIKIAEEAADKAIIKASLPDLPKATKKKKTDK
nr:MAG TPA: hypothetical protein [Caudoviricetes sp.]